MEKALGLAAIFTKFMGNENSKNDDNLNNTVADLAESSNSNNKLTSESIYKDVANTDNEPEVAESSAKVFPDQILHTTTEDSESLEPEDLGKTQADTEKLPSLEDAFDYTLETVNTTNCEDAMQEPANEFSEQQNTLIQNDSNEPEREDTAAALVGVLFDAEEKPQLAKTVESITPPSRPADLFRQRVLAAANSTSSCESTYNERIDSSVAILHKEDKQFSFDDHDEKQYDAQNYDEPGKSESEGEQEDDDRGSQSSEDDEDAESVCTNQEESLDSGIHGFIKYFTPREVCNGKVIGEGGFGRVLKGNLVTGTPVAIKLFHSPLHENYRDELAVLATIKHKNIVSVFGIVDPTEEIDCPQLVLQYFSECNILQYLSRPDNPEDNSTLGKIALDVIEGCRYLHQRGIVHGNLAARNVLVGRVVGRLKIYFNAKITDVGIIRFAEASSGNYMKIPGSDRVVPVRWVPREIIEEHADGTVGSDFTTASDVWAFGVVLWEMFTRGAIPYGASYSNLRVIQFLKDGYSPLKVYRPKECPPKVVSVMESIFRIKPNERPSFDAIHEHFKIFKGYGKENKPKVRASSKATRPASPVSGDDKTKKLGQMEPNLEDEKASFAKKKKNKKSKKLLQGKFDKLATEPTSPNAGSSRSAQFPNEMDGAHALPESAKPKYKSMDQNQSESTDSTVAALLKRVNQLEKERYGGGYRGRGGRGTRGSQWDKRVGAPRFGRGGYQQDYGGNTSSVMTRSISPPLPPPSSSLAPPPYTEEPLPHHSVSRFSAPITPEYEYPGSSRGVRMSLPGPSGQRHHRSEVLEPQSSSSVGGREEDVIRKIKRLAEEIEYLRAEKMTQELLKKSAELADIMKIVTAAERTDSSSVAVDTRFQGSSHVSRPVSHRHGASRAEPYYEEGYDGYEGDYGSERWSSGRGSYDYHRGHPHSPRHRGRGGSSQRRPFYKGRGSPSRRGGYHNGRYNDGDDGYGYGN